MSSTRNFTARVYQGVAGPLIEVKGDINCGFLTVLPTLEKKIPQGFNPHILELVAFPASEDLPENFHSAEYHENLNSSNAYTSVELLNTSGTKILSLDVKQG